MSEAKQKFWADPRDRDPEVRKERVKLLLGGLNATGVALLLGSTVAPFLDPARSMPLGRTVLGAIIAATLIFAAWLMRYIKRKDRAWTRSLKPC